MALVRGALGQLLARPARSWPPWAVRTTSWLTSCRRAGRRRVPGCAGRGPGSRIACPAAARDRRKLGYQVLVQVFLARGRRSSSLVPPPYAVVLPGVQRESQALAPDGAAGADRRGLGDLIQGGARCGDREEQFRVSMPACGQLPPVPVRDGHRLVVWGPGGVVICGRIARRACGRRAGTCRRGRRPPRPRPAAPRGRPTSRRTGRPGSSARSPGPG